MKTIKVTHIDTGGHGYYSVAKTDFLLVLNPEFITGCSGHSLTRIYLEEDLDATTFFEAAKVKGIEVQVKSSYNLNFKITHNYKPEFFNWKPIVGEKVQLHDGFYTIIEVNAQKMIIAAYGKRYGISLNNPFQYILGTVTAEPEPDKAIVMKWAAERIGDLILQANGTGAEATQAQAKYDKILELSPDDFYKQALTAYKSELFIKETTRP
jgi:hypothetical protein